MNERPANLYLALLASVLLAGCSSTSQISHDRTAGPSSWPMYQLNPAHNAVLASATLPEWTYEAGAKINSGMALVANDLIFDTFGGKIVALDVYSGKPRWIASADNVLMSTPAVMDGAVVVGTGRNGALGAPRSSFVYAANVNTDPNEVWGRLEGDHELAFDLANGTKRWSYRTAGENMPSAAISAGVAIFASGDRHVYGLRLRTGDLLWRADLRGVSTMASANVWQGVAVVSACDLSTGANETRALRVANGSLRWRVPYGNCDAAPTIGAGLVFLNDVKMGKRSGHYIGRGFITAVDLKTGTMRWQYVDPKAGPFTTKGSSERAIAGTYANGLYVASIPTSNSLLAFDAVSGAVAWRFHSRAPIKMSPVIANGHLYAGDTGGTFYDLRASTGLLISQRTFKKPFSTAPPIIVGKTALVVTTDEVRAIPL